MAKPRSTALPTAARVIALITLPLLSPTAVLAEQLCSTGQLIPIRSAPGGAQSAQVYPRGCLETTDERRESWVKVRVEGWVNVDHLPNAETAQPSAIGMPVGVKEAIGLLRHEVVIGAKDGQGRATQAQLKLLVKNDSGTQVSAWNGILVAQDSKGKELFRYRVSDDASNLAPSATREIVYTWRAGDPAFAVLANTPTTELRLYLRRTALGKN